ncbi:hypothetical protein GCM10027610_023520 [Dactylosporangium cerinum]
MIKEQWPTRAPNSRTSGPVLTDEAMRGCTGTAQPTCCFRREAHTLHAAQLRPIDAVRIGGFGVVTDMTVAFAVRAIAQVSGPRRPRGGPPLR